MFQLSLEKWQLPAQIRMVAEEASELSVASLHMLRASKEDVYEHFAEEIADVEFMVEEMKYYFPSLKKDISKYRKIKEERLKEKLEK